jgi:two-component system, NtrC family, response regulator AtoC
VEHFRQPVEAPYESEPDTARIESGIPLPTTSTVQAEEVLVGESQPSVEDLPGNWSYVAASPAMREVREQVRLVAKIDVPVLLLGESGTGKEVVARLIHKQSLRSQRTFMKVNCTALPVELLESELFGHEAGAFTGARQSKPGKFEICHKGTILLDEIAEMPIPPQAKLLHVLQDGEFSRLGSPTPTRVDVRVLAATNVDVTQAIETHRLRTDLYYRLNAFTIHLPPLRARRADIPILLDHFIVTWADRFGRPRLPVSARMRAICMDYSWPGNVRELENFAKCYLVLGDEDRVLAKLGAGSNGKSLGFQAAQRAIPSDCSNLKSLVRGLKQEAEKEVILRALEQTSGSRKDAAAMLKISLRALQYKIRQYGLDRPQSYSKPSAA